MLEGDSQSKQKLGENDVLQPVAREDYSEEEVFQGDSEAAREPSTEHAQGRILGRGKAGAQPSGQRSLTTRIFSLSLLPEREHAVILMCHLAVPPREWVLGPTEKASHGTSVLPCGP